MKQCAVLCSCGLGDGLIFLIVAHNLAMNGYRVTVFHDFLDQLQPFWPHLRIVPYPREEEISKVLSVYDWIILNSDHRKKNRIVQELGKERKEGYWEIHATTCRGKDLPGNVRLNSSIPLTQNLVDFCHVQLQLSSVCKTMGFVRPKELIFRKEKKRVVIHPMSQDPKKNWPMRKYLKLAQLLDKEGFSPKLCLASYEAAHIQKSPMDRSFFASFSSLKELAYYFYESGYFIGNDSGPGHLAASMGIPTLSIFSSKRKELFWKPDWGQEMRTVLPIQILPNFKKFRWREKYWKPFLGVHRLFSEFMYLVEMEK